MGSSANGDSVSIDSPLNKYGWTALHTACYFGHLDIVEYLVRDLGADVNAKSSRGWNSLVFAIFGGHLDVIDFLIYDSDVDKEARDSQDKSVMDLAF